MKRLARAALAVGVGVVCALVLGSVGAQAEFAWGWGVLAAAATLLTGLRVADGSRADAPGRTVQAPYASSDVSRLAWAINLHRDSVGEAVVRRLRATLRRRLSRQGIDVDDDRHADAVDRALGAGLWARLNGQGVRVQDLHEALAAAERLAPADRTDPTAEEAHGRRSHR